MSFNRHRRSRPGAVVPISDILSLRWRMRPKGCNTNRRTPAKSLLQPEADRLVTTHCRHWDVRFPTGMEHATLVAFLEGMLAPEQFGDEVGEEVSACNEALRSEGMNYCSPSAPMARCAA
jgi:hypothetical protein